MRVILCLLAGASLTSCAALPSAPRAERDAMRLQEATEGRVAGQAASCLPHYRSGDMTILDNGTLLFRDGRTTWVNQLREGCAGAGWGHYALVTRTYGGVGLCGGDIVELVDLSSGSFAGACTVGDFVPYRRP